MGQRLWTGVLVYRFRLSAAAESFGCNRVKIVGTARWSRGVKSRLNAMTRDSVCEDLPMCRINRSASRTSKSGLHPLAGWMGEAWALVLSGVR